MFGPRGYDFESAEDWADLIVAAMKLGGIDYLFFVSGAELTFYQEAIAKAEVRGTPAPKLISLTHEHVALNAALGNAMYRNLPAATAVHVDAGTLHQGAAIHTAWRGNYPVLMTAGTGPRAYAGSMPGSRNVFIQSVQEPRDQGEIVRQYTKIDHRLEHQDNPGLMIGRMLQLCMSGPKGPAYLTIPRETALLPADNVRSFPTLDYLGVSSASVPADADASRIAEWLLDGENPVILLQRSGRDPRAVSALTELIDLIAVPIKDCEGADRMNFPATHWAYGTAGRVDEADVVVHLDVVSPYVAGHDSPSVEAKTVWISPDPVLSRYKTFEHRADLWIPCEAYESVVAIREAVESMLTPDRRDRIEQRRSQLKAKKQLMVAELEAAANADIKAGKLNGRTTAHALGKVLDEDAIILNDGLSNSSFVRGYTARSKPATYFTSGGTSGGWGSGAAFGIKLSAGDRDVVLASGDGFYMFGDPLSALLGARQHNAPYLSVIFVNGSYSTGTTGLTRSYPDGYATSSGYDQGGRFAAPVPNFAKLAESVDCLGVEVSELEDLSTGLEKGLQACREGIPAVVAVHVPGP